ncbi:serine hydroxymethyltransferase [Candidatus Dojkabacteria bacterium]|uniref:Serine hydroxymethyltransferase n=1 Tax=Candidatus Dojkabacteria bacterium TaxID=2099670 RepID=A0A955IEX6_9BACT|nr:serine hydroxymethyltransferase [Candidatus Dojkabacteria bacterium]
MNKIKELIQKEYDRQHNTLGMIPSENYTSKEVREAVGSVFMHKYSEGYPAARYYEGNEVIDELEGFVRDMAVKVMTKHDSKEVQNNWHANVQVLSGSAANLAVYTSILEPGDKILSMYLPDGGHLSHGWSYSSKKDRADSLESEGIAYKGGKKKVNFTSKVFDIVQYKTDPNTFVFDYDQIEKLAVQEQPKLIITGGTAYPRDIDYQRMREIADKVGAYYHADAAHEAGLIAGGAVSSPFEYADFVTFTTHKTLRGPKGAVAMCRKEFSKNLDRAVFPGLQGGPFNHTIAGVGQAFIEADTKDFENYAKQIVKNAQVLADELVNAGLNVITKGTDKHLVLVEVLSDGISGSDLASKLAEIGIIANKNTVPYEKGSPVHPSGFRLGTPILTTRGMKEDAIKEVAEIIIDLFNRLKNNKEDFADLKDRVNNLCLKYKLPN